MSDMSTVHTYIYRDTHTHRDMRLTVFFLDASQANSTCKVKFNNIDP